MVRVQASKLRLSLLHPPLSLPSESLKPRWPLSFPGARAFRGDGGEAGIKGGGGSTPGAGQVTILPPYNPALSSLSEASGCSALNGPRLPQLTAYDLGRSLQPGFSTEERLRSLVRLASALEKGLR